VSERERRAVRKDRRVAKGRCGVVDRRRRKARERRHLVRLGARAEDAHGPRHLLGVVRQPLEPQQHPPRHALRRDLAHRLRGRGRAALRERSRQLVHEQRVAAGRGGAGLRETRVGRRAEALRENAGDGVRAERAWPHALAGRAQLGERRRARLLGAHRHHHRYAVLVDPRRDEGQEAERRVVEPLRVVDQHERRRLVGEAGDDPVEAVKEPRRRRGSLRARVEQQLRGERAGAAQPRLALRGAGLAQERRQQLARAAERPLALELRAARAEDPDRFALRRASCRPQQRGLADAGRALDEHEPPLARARGRDRPVEYPELGFAPCQTSPHAPSLRRTGPTVKPPAFDFPPTAVYVFTCSR
jgi:hypothetical protein